MAHSKVFWVTSIIMLLIMAVVITWHINAPGVAQAESSAGGESEAMPVVVEAVKPEPVRIWNQFSARMTAVDYAEIKPQVSGTITAVKFEDGQNVEKGDVLFVIDPRPYKAVFDQAQAELNAANDRSALAQREKLRAADLVKTDAISQRVYDERVSAAHIAAADVSRAKALLEQARINLDYAYVEAPISGQTSRAEIKVGNRVEAGPLAPVLTSIVSRDGIYADFEIDEQTYLRHKRATAEKQTKKIPVRLQMMSDDVTHLGSIHSFDNRIDPESGTIRARAYFDNAEGDLLPGMFASVFVGEEAVSDKILITEKAIGTDQDRKFVYVVGENNEVIYTPVQIGDSVSGRRVILSGLNAGDQVITEGVIRIRPGMMVAPQKQDKQEEDNMPPPPKLEYTPEFEQSTDMPAEEGQV